MQFETGKLYKTGDYWLIPSRVLTGTIEWFPEAQIPHGTQHRYCSLALLERTPTQITVLADCRSIFKPITSGLVSKAGDTMTGSLSINADLYVDGKVGIGTAIPNAKLEVKGSGGQAVDLIVNGRLKSDDNDGGLWVKADRFVGGHSTDKIGFFSNAAWQLTVQSDGNVGIGTSTPKNKLSVSGGVAIGASYADQAIAPNNGLVVQSSISLGQMGNWRIERSPRLRLKQKIEESNNIWGYEEAIVGGNFLILDDPGNLYICPINTSLLKGGNVLNVLLKRPSQWTFSALSTRTYSPGTPTVLAGFTPGLTPEQTKVTDWREGQDLPGEMQDDQNGADYVEGYRFWVVKAGVDPPPGIIILIFTRIV